MQITFTNNYFAGSTIAIQPTLSPDKRTYTTELQNGTTLTFAVANLGSNTLKVDCIDAPVSLPQVNPPGIPDANGDLHVVPTIVVNGASCTITFPQRCPIDARQNSAGYTFKVQVATEWAFIKVSVTSSAIAR